MKTRRIAISVRNWGSEEAVYTWKYCKSHLLQVKDGGQGTPWSDEVSILHVNRSKDRERWDVGGPVIPDLQTAIQPYNSLVVELEGDAGPGLVEYAHREMLDILVLASRGRGAMKKAMMGSTSEYVMSRVACACLVVKPMVGAGDTYRMKSAASVVGTPQPSASGGPRSPASSPMFRTTSLGQGPVHTPFNRRVAIAYDATANGRFLLQWAVKHVLEPSDNIFVVRAVPGTRHPGTSFADKDNVQRLAGDALPAFPHVTTYNLQGGRKSVLTFVGKERLDLLITGIFRSAGRHKGLAVRNNAHTIANLCACPCMLVPMTDASLAQAIKPTDLALAEEEQELDSCSEAGSDEMEEGAEAAAKHESGAGGGATLEARFRAFSGLDSFWFGKKRTGAEQSPTSDAGASRQRGPAALPGLPAGKYVIEVDAAGAICSIHQAKTSLEVGAPVQLLGAAVPPALLGGAHHSRGEPGSISRVGSLPAHAASAGDEDAAAGGFRRAASSASTSPSKHVPASRLRNLEEVTGAAAAAAAGVQGGSGAEGTESGEPAGQLLQAVHSCPPLAGPNGVAAAGGLEGREHAARSVSHSGEPAARRSLAVAGSGEEVEGVRSLLQQREAELAAIKAQLAHLAGLG